MNLVQTKEGFSAILTEDEKNKIQFQSSIYKPIYVNVPENPRQMPFLIQLYVGGLSIMGLYLLYNIIRKPTVFRTFPLS
jgi:hypothetical protein